MHWIQHKYPDTYHVVQWENSAFHNHESTAHNKRKLLGGVSFDQGAVSGGQSHTKAPASFGMPVSVSSDEKSISGIGPGIEPGIRPRNAIGAGKGAKADKSVKTDYNEKTGKYEANVSDMIREALSGAESGKRFKRAAFLLSAIYHRTRYSLRAGIGTKQQKQEKKKDKKNVSGTRSVSKEEMYAAQAQSSYLLDSYNKFGERSVLGNFSPRFNSCSSQTPL